MKRLSRMVREVYPEIEPENEGNQAQVCIVGDVVYGSDETVPAEQPCLKCRCQPPGVQCETIQCVKKPGCKAIHKSNKCCPDYQCECEHNGKIYANGEKLETPPGGECKVCYCRGGEVQCAEVSCYVRKDCEGKRVPGKCCPKFDHCPPIDPLPGRSPFTTEISIISNLDTNFQPWPDTRFSQNATEEIILSPASIDIQEENKIPDTNYYEVTTPSYRLTEVDQIQKESIVPKITIQEIIPERKEIPVTAPPKLELESQGTLIIEEAEEFLNHSNDLVVTDADADSSEISEVFHHPPPVLRIGDKLLFLKKGEFVHEKDTSTPNSVITIIGAEGLQRGGFEDSGEVHEVKIENVPEDNKDSSNFTVSPIDTISVDSIPESNPDLSLDPNVNASELNTAASTHILSLVKKKNKPSTTTTTETYITTSTTEFEIISPTTETNSLQDVVVPGSTNIPENNDSNTTEGSRTTLDTLDTLTTEETKNITSTTAATVVDNTTEVNDLTSIPSSTKAYENILDQNPAYPPIPDVMISVRDDASQRFDTEVTEREHTVQESSTIPPSLKILPEVLEMRSNKTVPTNISNNEWLKVNPESLINYKAALPDDILNQAAPTEIENITDNTNDINITIPETTTETFSTYVDFNTTTEETITEYEKELETTTTNEVVTDNNKKLEALITESTDTSTKEEVPRSTESIEEISDESRESTTRKSHASITTNENASIEYAPEDSSEAEDMSSNRGTANNNSGEETTPSTLDDSGVIDKEWNDSSKNNTNGNSKDVEFVDAVKTKKPVEKHVDTTTTTTTTVEHLPRPQKLILLPKSVSKRESRQDEELDDTSKERSKEITGRSISSEEEDDDRQSQEIFKQLLEDTSTLKPKNSGETVPILQKVVETISQYTPQGQNPHSLLRFFSNQKYDRK
ncbi:hypothetical protein NQ315_000106 [Exocentrus adspersus]|uniref:VWFC domain-containing protein n=1 Tax=Exocentrus adspersus TaxID=1586481 RepID=A0AAV8VTH2_9CUCU|nr:hypothetical protein NQ315_000106 [Exocentrus adspersus]